MATRISASRFKKQCLALLDHLDSEGLIVTKDGMPVARVLPAQTDCKDLIGSMAGKMAIHGDIGSTGIQWDAES